ncbi:MAG: VOC family protein [Armatimonadota bacterium]
MPRQIFVNLPVKDVQRSIAFFTALGFSFEPRFTGEHSACIVIDDHAFVHLLAEDAFKTFTPKELCDATRCTEVLVALSCDSREQVDETVAKAAAAGGKIPREAQDHGFMYVHAFEDPDGHLWELGYMEPGAMGGGRGSSSRPASSPGGGSAAVRKPVRRRALPAGKRG